MDTQEFLDWKSQGATKWLFEGLQELEAILTKSLTHSAGQNPSEDRFKVGYIAALRDIYLIQPEEGGTDR